LFRWLYFWTGAGGGGGVGPGSAAGFAEIGGMSVVGAGAGGRVIGGPSSNCGGGGGGGEVIRVVTVELGSGWALVTLVGTEFGGAFWPE